MKNLLLSSFGILVLLSSCAPGHYGKLKPYVVPATDTTDDLKPVFGNYFNSFLFKTNIRIYNKSFSGLLVSKQMDPGTYRIVFTTELGMKIFDFEFRDTSFTLHYCAPQFNRPALLKTLKKDIEILLMNNLEKVPVAQFHDKKNEFLVQRVAAGHAYNYYFKKRLNTPSPNNQFGNLTKIEHAGKRNKKITFTIDDYREGIPNEIIIKHHDIRLKIEMHLLKQ